MARAKADKGEVERRVGAIYKQLLRGWSAARICENARVSYGISDSQTYRYIGRAWERIEREGAPERARHHARAVALAYELLGEADGVQESLKVLHALARLLGLYAAKCVELSTPEDKDMVIRVQYVSAREKLGALIERTVERTPADDGSIDYRQFLGPRPPEAPEAADDGEGKMSVGY
jgi:hypothetical protein